MQNVTDALFSLKEATASLRLGVFLIFIVDEVKNFAVNNIFKLLELVMYWDLCKRVAFIY